MAHRNQGGLLLQINNSITVNTILIYLFWAVAIPAVLGPPALADEFNVGDLRVTAHGIVSIGTAIDAANPGSNLIGAPNGGTGSSAHNSDDSNLNYKSGQPVSTVLKGFGSVDVRRDDFGLFLSAKAWTDFTLQYSTVPWGNIANGYMPNSPLSDSGFENRAKFSGASLQAAFAYGKTSIAGIPVTSRVGYQVIPWGLDTIPGGLNAINAIDLAALHRPGAQAEETSVPMPAVFNQFEVGPNLRVETFYQFGNVHTILDGCGTYFASASDMSQCPGGLYGPGTDRIALINGQLVTRSADVDHSNFQGGIGLNYTLDTISTNFGAYYAHTDWRSPSIDIFSSSRSHAVPLIPFNPDGKNFGLAFDYVPNVDTVAFNSVTKLKTGTTFQSELTYRANQPIGLRGNDVLNGFGTATAPSLIRNDVNNLPLGATYPAYDRHETAQLDLGISQEIKNSLGAQGGYIGAEVQGKYLFDLPDVNVRRYGRPDIFGDGPVYGVCHDLQQLCNYGGFVTSLSTTMRLKAGLTYVNVLPDLDLSPTVTYGYDISGWSYDNVISQGQNVAIVALHAIYKKDWFADLVYSMDWGGEYNINQNRKLVVLSVGVKF